MMLWKNKENKVSVKDIIKADIARGYDNRLFGKAVQLKYIIAWRKAVYYGRKHPLGIYYRIRLKSLSERSGIQIPTDTKIGKGLLIAHFGTIIINPAVTMGDNINIAPNVLIGKTNRGGGENGNDIIRLLFAYSSL